MKKSILMLVFTLFILNNCSTKEKIYVETDSPRLVEHTYKKEVFEPFTLDYKVVR